MITLPKNNKRIENTLELFIKVILERENITHNVKYSNELNDYELLEFYREKGLEDYQLHVSHKLITEMPFNKQINLDFMKNSPNFRFYKIPKGKYHQVNYGVTDEIGNSYIPLVTFDQDITLPMICEDNIGWMTPVLFEETTMRPCVEKAFGNVLVVGLGIGFFPFNILLKENVEKVTIIEYNKEIIDLFKEHILPQFPRRECIEIIHGDAYDYLHNDYIKQYDYTFVDIWKNNEDGVCILSKCLKGINLEEDLNIDFWVEDTILEDVKGSLKIYLYKMYKGELDKLLTGYISDNEFEVENFITFDKIHRYFKGKNIKIKTNADLMEFVNSKHVLRDLLKSF